MAVGSGDGDRDARLLHRDLDQVVPRAQLGRDVRHDLLGHPFVGLALEVHDRSPSGLDARRAEKGRDRAGVVGGHLGDDGSEAARLAEEGAAVHTAKDDRRSAMKSRSRATPRRMGLGCGRNRTAVRFSVWLPTSSRRDFLDAT